MGKVSLGDVLKVASVLLGVIASACLLYSKLSLIDYRLTQVERQLGRLLDEKAVAEVPANGIVRR